MPRRPRLFVSGGIYHIYCRTHRGEFRFDDRLESDSFMEAVRDVQRRHGLLILAWCLMSNHYHLVVQTADVKLWRSMAGIHGRVTKSFNLRHRVFGPGWQGRYRARLIQDGDDLRNLLAYVHLNPVIAGLGNDPKDYELSGHREIMGFSNPVLVDVASALRCFEKGTTALARGAYLDFIRRVAEAKWARTSVRRLPWWKPVKNNHQTVAEEDAPVGARTFDDKYPNLTRNRRESLDSLLKRAAILLGLSMAKISGQGKDGEVSLARRRFTLIASCYFDHSLKSIAEALGKSSSQVSRWLKQETEAYHLNTDETTRIDETTAALLEQQISKQGSTCA